MKELHNRSAWIDNLRVMATLAVITVHVATPAVFTQFNQNNTAWWIGNVYDSFCRFCVPVFVMITGALLLPQNIGLKDFLKKRLNRLLWPFIFWSLIYIAYNLALKYRDEKWQAFNHLAHWLLEQVVQGPGPHLWYVYMIIGIYLFIPIIKPWVIRASNNEILYFLGIWLATIIAHQQKLLHLSTYFDLNYFSGYIGYLVLGYFIAERIVITKTRQYVAAALCILGYVVTLTGTYWITSAQGNIAQDFYNYLTINVLLTATGLFILIKSRQTLNRQTYITKCRDMVSRYGYGIYLAHLLVLDVMWHFKLDDSLTTPILSIPVCVCICLVFSYILVRIIHRLPYGKYIGG